MGLTPSFAQAAGSEVEVAVPTQDCSINMGAQHPATHGVMRLLLNADGEVLTGAQAHLGDLQRCAEKIGEMSIGLNISRPQIGMTTCPP